MITNRFSTRNLVLLLLMLALGATVACGGDNEAQVVEAPTEAPATEAPAQPTAVPPTAAPPTAEPTAEPPTEEPEQVFAPGECGNAFYPVVDGRAMTYSTNAADLGAAEYTTIFTNVTDSSFTLTTDLGDGDVFATDWQCSTEGLLSPEFSQLPGGLEGMSIEFVDATGVTIPSENMFQVGESWPTHYVANATMAIDDTSSLTMIQTIDMTNTVTGIESVTVPAGDYPEAVVVETVSTISTAMSNGDEAQPAMTIEMNYTSWYVEGVGLVKQEITEFFGDSGGSYITELIAVQ